MTIETDNSTPRQWESGTSPLTQIREFEVSEGESKAVEAVSAAYIAILRSPINEWRIEVGMDGTLARLRDFLAEANGSDPRDIQDLYESAAKARGDSHD